MRVAVVVPLTVLAGFIEFSLLFGWRVESDSVPPPTFRRRIGVSALMFGVLAVLILALLAALVAVLFPAIFLANLLDTGSSAPDEPPDSSPAPFYFAFGLVVLLYSLLIVGGRRALRRFPLRHRSTAFLTRLRNFNAKMSRHR